MVDDDNDSKGSGLWSLRFGRSRNLEKKTAVVVETG
jgi:hypothetical protein